jgi:cysteine desulfurase/selenocysteine lyase
MIMDFVRVDKSGDHSGGNPAAGLAGPPRWRADFPVLGREMNGRALVWLDTAASAQKPQSVIDAMADVLEKRYANVHRGLYAFSQRLTSEFEGVRAKVAAFIGAQDREIVFTRNATDSVNLVARSWGAKTLKAGDEILLSAMEHHANLVPWMMLRDSLGVVLKTIPLDSAGALDLDAYRGLLSARTRLVALTHLSNVLGTVNPVAAVIREARAYDPTIKIFIDGAQGIVHESVDIRGMDPDFYVFTGHKLYGPTGVGILYGKYEHLDAMPPLAGGGDMIESVSWEKCTYRPAPHRFEAGTPPIVEVIGLGAAIDYVTACGREALADHERDLTAYAVARLEEVPGLTLYGRAPHRAGIFSFNLEGVSPSDVAMILDRMGIALRAGHHCCMPLMETLGVEGTARASLGLYSSREDVDRLIEGLNKVRDLTG